MKRKTLLYIIVGSLLLFMGACASAPEEEPEIPVVDDVAQNEAAALRETIIEYGLDEYEADEFAAGDAQFSAGTANLVDDPESAGENFRMAIGHFETVISRGFPTLLGEREEAAEAVREEALAARADVAAATVFSSADTKLARAQTQRADGSFEASFVSFNEATVEFADARDTAVERRERAQAALDRANQRLEEAEERARELDEEVDED
ncbi:MAG: hypothetical protein EA383_12500 [Spirochaetaceae bacterium]|nr:MAG: hypothetical protein EA383_12500 [Spirochaetaceae bacterium]